MSPLLSASYTPARFQKTHVPSARTRHVLQRFTGGWTPALGRQVTARGGIDRWFAAQLTPSTFPDPWFATTRAWWPSLTASHTTLWQWDRSGKLPMWEAEAEYQRWSLLRRIGSSRQVLETMSAFWEDHLQVPIVGEGPALFRAAYGQTIRARALGRYADLLFAAVTHPAMCVFLGNATSTKKAPNENLGRELLELHTVGRGAPYTEDDVKTSARILTGWRVDTWNTWKVWYEPNAHWTGPVSALGFSHPNSDPDGRAVTRAWTDHLARRPETAKRIARKLAVRFVSDDPPQALINRLANVYLRNDTQIRPVLRALVASPEFAASAGRKVRTPEEDVIATYRALNPTLTAPTGEGGATDAMLWQSASLGLEPFAWPRPDGRPDRAEAWTGTSRMLASLEMHWGMSGGWWPTQDIRHRPSRYFIPQPMRFDLLVDHLSRVLLGRTSTARLLQACCEATGRSVREIVPRDIDSWYMALIVTTILDSPAHFTR